ncbi:MAG: hypothetical protein DSZ00_10230 [Gammaproteobacteria bacterium]|nr:MAG: hypothetical protein DSZ00_10230 [Gammaproteobacteria bacterium]RTZ71944.1 MAG: hypothetical protein DSZ02_10335 [Gammaproteobacteria bacterium]
MNKYQQHAQETPAQVSADLVARMNRAEQQMASPKPGEEGIRGDVSIESVDFGSVLQSVSSRATEPLPEAFVQPSPEVSAGEPHRDRNLSSVIEMIRDEGPAGEDTSPEPAEDVLELSEGAEQPAAGPAEGVATPGPAGAPPAVTRQEHPRRHPFLTGLVVLLILAVAGLVFFTYQQVQRQAELEARVKAAQQVLTLLDERYQALEERTAAAAPKETELVGRSELQQALAQQQQRFSDELLLFTAAFAMPVQPSPGPAARQEPAQLPEKPQPVAKTGADEGKAAEKTAVAGNEPQAPGKTEKQMPAGRARGGWMVYLLSFGDREQAEKALARHAGKLPDAELRQAEVKGKAVYRLTVPGFASKKEALAYRSEARRKLGFKGAWIARDR